MNSYIIEFQKPIDYTDTHWRNEITRQLKKCITVLETLDYLPNKIHLFSGITNVGFMGNKEK